jgi:hypothetical protein
MKEFILSGQVTISVYTKVKADTLEEAIEKAYERDIESAQWGHDEQEYRSWISDEYDGEVCEIEDITE